MTKKRKKFHNKIGYLQNVYNFKEKKIIIAFFPTTTDGITKSSNRNF